MQHCFSSMEDRLLHQNLSRLASPPSSSSFPAEIDEKKKSVFENQSDEGYHTPTSPRHLIPPANECPPAPKKMKMRVKRKVEDRGRRRRYWVEEDEFDVLLNPKKKRTNEEDEENETTDTVH